MARALQWVTVMVAVSAAIGHDAAPRARAAGVVASCTEAAFDAAIAGGGTVMFACSGTITFTSTKTIDPGTALTIDGTGRDIKLSGGQTVQLFRVRQGGELLLRSLELSEGHAERGGAVIVEPGATLRAVDTAFHANAANLRGGAIHSDGTVALSRTVFTDNVADGGGAIIAISGQLVVIDSTFAGNKAEGPEDGSGGAISLGLGTASIKGSTFANNNSFRSGGAVSVLLATLEVTNSTFVQNSGMHGGGIASFGILTVTNSTFASNSASTSGAISNGAHGGITASDPRELTLRNTLLVANTVVGCISNKDISKRRR